MLAALLLVNILTSPQDSAPMIIARAIARRHDVQASIRSASYNATIKFAARDLGVPQDSAAGVLVLSETRSAAYWEPPDNYLETILARRQLHGRGDGHGLVQAGEIADALRDDIVLAEYANGARRTGRGRQSTLGYHVLSPVADGAPLFYDYAIQDTLLAQGRRVFRIRVLPAYTSKPLFTGTIDIADSTFDVLAMDLGVNAGVQFPSIDSLRYAVQFADAGDSRWLPSLVRLSGQLRPRVTSSRIPRQVAGFRLDMVPRHIAFAQTATLDSMRLDAGPRPADAGEYRTVVLEHADHPGSTAWTAPDNALTPAEETAMLHSDSLEQHPQGIRKLASNVGAVTQLVANPGFFHNNRVDGIYLGAAHDWRVTPALSITTRLGYGTGSETWQYRLGGEVLLTKSRRAWVGAWYHDETMSRPTLTNYGYNPTRFAFFARSDPLDYYREQGVTLALGVRLPGRIAMSLGLDDARQSTLDTISGLGPRRMRTPPRDNPAIVDGHLRDLSASLTWDSRQMIRSGGSDFRISGTNWTRVSLGAEVSAPSVIRSDFAYRRYTVQIQHQQRTFGLGNTTISLAAGTASDGVPPQRYFSVDFGRGVLTADGAGFNTLGRTNYYGNNAAMLVVRHDFGRVVRVVPFTFGINGGAFWTDFVDHVGTPGDSLLATASRPYTEAGFTLGNLTPFLSPFNLSARFSWQLSHYPTRPFRFEFGFSERW